MNEDRIRELANQFFMNELNELPSYKPILEYLDTKYDQDPDGEYPEAYWKERAELTTSFLNHTIALNSPTN